MGLLSQLPIYTSGASLQYPGSGGQADGDPAPGRSPGPPLGKGDHVEEPTVVTANDPDPCDLNGDLIVVDKDKASLDLNVTHRLFKSEVLTHGVVYQGKV